jgi:hypothetical protein
MSPKLNILARYSNLSPPPDESRDAHQQVYNDDQNEGKFSHELIGGAAAFEGMKLFEDRQRKEGTCRML